MPYPPYYLQNFVLTPGHHPKFTDDKLLYRRSKEPEPADHFDRLSTDELVLGISVNRSKLCPLPEDVLWAPKGGEPPLRDSDENFQFDKKEGYYVLYCPIISLKIFKPYKGISAPCFRVEFAPVVYNLAHSLLFVDGLNVEGLTKKEAKKEKTALRFWVSTFFHKYTPLQ